MTPERARSWLKVAMAAGFALPLVLWLAFGTSEKAPSVGKRVRIPGGSFAMGDDAHHPEEGPRHQVKVRTFELGVTEVTNREFAAFVAATGYVTDAEKPIDPRAFPHARPEDLLPGGMVFRLQPGLDARMCGAGDMPWWHFTPGANWRHPEGPDSSISDRMEHPVVQVTYRDALAYCRWAGGRLPTEAEWERAARGGLDGKAYVWGDEERPEGKFMANHWQGGFPSQDLAEDGFNGTAPVGSFPANGYGLYDMAGNVWEYTSDWYDPGRYVGEEGAADPRGPAAGDDPEGTGFGRRAMRGGSWLCDRTYCFRFRPSARHGVDELTATNHTGFRVVWEELR